MIRCIIDPISQGDSHQALIDNIDKEKFDKFMQMKLPLKFRVEAANKKYTEEERDSIINLWGVFGYDDKVIDLKNPKQIYNVLGGPRTNQYYFGLELGYKNTKVSKDGGYSTKYDLKQRPYLGPTSTSHDLAFMMANQAEVKEGDLVYDPFVGTGSILVAGTIMKAFCFGSDIDVRVLQGYSVGHKATKEIAGTDDIKRYDVYTNFKYYNLPKPLIVSMDISYPLVMHNKFDAIICDPPYGVKAGCKKTKPHQKKPSATKEDSNIHSLNEEEKISSLVVEESKDTAADERMIGVFTRKENYGTNKIYDTLLNVASKFLKLGGKLVFLFHTDISYSPEHNEFPSHPGFKFVHSGENPLMTKRSRHSIKMIKIKEPDELII